MAGESQVDLGLCHSPTSQRWLSPAFFKPLLCVVYCAKSFASITCTCSQRPLHGRIAIISVV